MQKQNYLVAGNSNYSQAFENSSGEAVPVGWLSTLFYSMAIVVFSCGLLTLSLTPAAADNGEPDFRGDLIVSMERLTAEDEVVAPGQRVRLFSGTMTQTGEYPVDLTSLIFSASNFGRFNQDDIDTLVIRLSDIGPFPTIETVELPFELDAFNRVQITPADLADTSFFELGFDDVVEFQVEIIIAGRSGAVANQHPNHGANFALNFEWITAESNDVSFNISPSQGSSHPLTVLNAVVPYGSYRGRYGDLPLAGEKDSADGIPQLLASQSDRIPLFTLHYGGDNFPAGGQEVFLEQLAISFTEVIGEWIPERHLEQLDLVRSPTPKFDPATAEVVSGSAASLTDLLQTSSTPNVKLNRTYYEDNFYFLTIQTGRGWGESFEDAGQFFGYGEAFDVTVDTITLNTTEDDVDVDETIPESLFQGVSAVGPILNRALGEITAFGPDVGILDSLYADPVGQIYDGYGLDFAPEVLLGIKAIGTRGDTPTPGLKTQLEAITVEFPETIEGFNPRENLRELNQTRFSGLQIWYNREGKNQFGVEVDQFLPLSKTQTHWESDTRVRLVLQDGFTLPSPQEQFGSDTRLEYNRGVIDPGFTFFVAALTDRSSRVGQGFKARISPGGLHFDQGDLVDDPHFTSITPEYRQGIHAHFSKLTESDMQIGAPSPPVPVIGINASSHDIPSVLSQVDFYLRRPEDNTAFTQDDLNPLSNSDTSGISIYVDNRGHPDNIPGVFDAEIDTRLPLDLENSRKNAPGGTDRAILNRLHVDLDRAGADALVPAEDRGEDAGDNFFIVIRTSERADNQDIFQPVIGDFYEDDGIRPGVHFRRKSDSQPITRTFSKGDQFPSDFFFADYIRVNTLSALELRDLTMPGQQLQIASEPLPVLGINLADGVEGEQKLERIRLTVDFSDSADSTVVAELSDSIYSGFSLWRDRTADNRFDPAVDQLISLRTVSWINDTQVDLIPATPQEIPDENNDLTDFFVALRAGENLRRGDSLTIEIQGEDILFSVEKSHPTDQVKSHSLIGALPAIYTDMTAVEQPLKPGDTALELIGLRLASGESRTEYLEELTVRLENVGRVENFSIESLKKITADSQQTGLGLWRNSHGTEFDPVGDSFIEPVEISQFRNNQLTLKFSRDSGTVLPEELPEEILFYLAVRGGDNLNYQDDFRVGIPSGGLRTTNAAVERELYTDRRIYGDLKPLGPNLIEFEYDAKNRQLHGKVDWVEVADTVEIYRIEVDDVERATPLLVDTGLRDHHVGETATFRISVDQLDEGRYHLFGRVLHRYGFSADTMSLEFAIDRTPPQVSFRRPAEAARYRFEGPSDSRLVLIRTEDKYSEITDVKLYLNGANFAAGRRVDPANDDLWYVTITGADFIEGEYLLQAEATDAAGNTGSSAERRITVVEDNSNYEPVVVEPEISPVRLRGTSVDLVFEAPRQKELSVELKTAEHGFRVVATASPDGPEADIFSFYNLQIPLASDTALVRARGLDHSDVWSAYSETIRFQRPELYQGIERSDALASEPDFGYVLFGRRGGSNSNPDDPVFDPSAGESLRVVKQADDPQRNYELRIFTVDGRLVYETQGQNMVEWNGRNNSGKIVNNGLYIVHVETVGAVKSFPVMVVK